MSQFIVPAITAGAALFGGRKATKAAQKRSPEETQAIGQIQRGGRLLGDQSQELYSYGLPLLQGAGSYYQRLLSGDRAAIASHLAPERSQISDYYTGAGRAIERAGLRGGAREQATAELARERAGSLSRLAPAARTAAAGGAASLGGFGVSAGQQAQGMASSLWAQLLQSGFQNRALSLEEGRRGGEGIGRLLYSILNPAQGGRGGGGDRMFGGISWLPGGGIESIPPTPGVPSWLFQ